jgi:hypothetical protein
MRNLIHQINPRLILCIVMLSGHESLKASPITSTWAGGSGDWSAAAQWILPGIPLAGYQVLINNTTPLSQVTVDIPTAVLNNVGIASAASLTLTADLSSGEVTSFGIVNVGSGAILNAGTGGFVQDTSTAATTVSAGGSLLDTGSYSQGGGSTLVNGQLTTPLLHVTGGAVTTGTGGILTVGAGGYTQDLAVTTQINSGGQMNLTGDFSQGNGSTIVNGTLSTPLLHATGGTISVGSDGVLSTGSGGFTLGTPGTAATIASGGQIDAIGGNYAQEIGTSTTVDGTLTADVVNNSGTVSGTGLINGNFNDLGTIAPGDEKVGALDIAGDYSQTGLLDIDLSGLGSSSVLNVTGDAVLGGTLDVSLLDGFVPVPGDTFLVMTYGSVSGSFYAIAEPGLPVGEFWEATYGPNAIYLTLATQSPAIPEPDTTFLLVSGLGALLWARRNAAIHDPSRRDAPQ